MKKLTLSRIALACGLFGLAAAATATTLTVSSALPRSHMWIADYKEPLMKELTQNSGGTLKFTPFFAGSLVGYGRELDALQNGVVDVVMPLVAPYHEGQFPLADVTQLPTIGTDGAMVTRAFQKMLDSDKKIVGDKTFYQYELGDKGVRGWAVAGTAAYSMSTTGKELKSPEDFRGLPIRSGSAIQAMFIEQLGATPITMPGSETYESLSRGTISGTVLAVADWDGYGLQRLLRYTIEDMSIGHWQSYVAISDAAWKRLTDAEKKAWDESARAVAISGTKPWEEGIAAVKEEAIQKYQAKFVSFNDTSPELQQHVQKAARDTWMRWIAQTDKNGHPGTAAAKLYAEHIIAEGGKLPEGVAAHLGLAN